MLHQRFSASLCTAPRGGSLCFAVAHRVHQPVWSAMLHATWHPEDIERRQLLIAALADVAPASIEQLGATTGFAEAIAESVDEAMYWQEPRDQDLLLRFPEVREALLPIATAIAATATAVGWHSPVDRSQLRATERFQLDGRQPTPPLLTGASERLAAWRTSTLDEEAHAQRERPRDLRSNWSGSWWSKPVFADLTSTTRPLPGLGSATLVWEEDSMGFDHAEIWPLDCAPGARVYEVDGPDDWAALVRAYPLEVTASRRHDWYRVTGRDGAWAIPDYPAVAKEWDAIHVTVAGYLTTATRSIQIDDERATVLAGWEPDQTWWLTDTLTNPAPPTRWLRNDEHGDQPEGWRQADAPAS